MEEVVSALGDCCIVESHVVAGFASADPAVDLLHPSGEKRHGLCEQASEDVHPHCLTPREGEDAWVSPLLDLYGQAVIFAQVPQSQHSGPS